MKVIDVEACHQCPYICTRNYGTTLWCQCVKGGRELYDETLTIPDWCPLKDKEAP